MSIKAYDAAPYNDDFNTSSIEGKNYLRILFKPGFSVQVRELNQMQSILQSQIDKFGRSIYKEGPVIDGTTYFSDNTDFIDVEMAITTLNNNMNLILGNTIRVDGTLNTSLSAEIFDYKLLSTSGNQTWRFYIRYSSSGATTSAATNTSTFSADDVIEIDTEIDVTGSILGAGTDIGTIVKTGYAGTVTYDKGIFFARGSFIYNDTTQYLHIEKPSNTFDITGKAVFQLLESAVSASADSQLYDNAQGTPNHQAPGADRYAVTLTPKFITDQSEITSISNNSSILGTTASSTINYLELLDVSVSQYIAPARMEYTELDNTLAIRTSEESGDYTVNPFKVSVREHFNNAADNGGRYLSSELSGLSLTEEQSKAKYIATIEPSVAYVQGYRAPLEETLEITVDKARTQLDSAETTFGSAEIGNYIEGTADGLTEVPDFNNPTRTYTFTDNSGTALSPAVTCRIRAIEKVGSVFRAYIYDLSGDIPNAARKLKGHNAEGTADAFLFTLSDVDETAPTPIFDTSANTSFISLPYNTISSISTGDQVSEVIIRTVQTGVSPSNNELQLTVSGMTGKSHGRFFNDSLSSYIIIDESDGSVVDATDIEFVTGTNNKTIKLSASTSNNCTVIAPVKMSLSGSGLELKTKTVATATAELVTAGVDSAVATNDIFDLDNRDIIAITSVTDGDGSTTIPATDYELDNGQRDGLYKVGKIKYTGSGLASGNSPATGGLKVTYTYYQHSASGDYFAVNSYPGYTGSGYADIPQYKGIYLSDVLDFRPADNDTSAFTLDPNSPTKIKLNHYLGRMDKVIVNTLGDFSVLSGEPDTQPNPPIVPVNSLALYDIFVPAYTRDITDIQLRYIDNRRFTMKDIGRLEKRIENLEYYTSLSLLEREANGKQIIDSNGERFKNGIIVDNFQTQGIADVLDPGLSVSFDTEQGELRPLYTLDNKRLNFTGRDGNDDPLTRTDGGSALLTLPYTHTPLIIQDTATIDISVNPYDLATWNGTIELSPSSDEWIEVNRRPDVVMNLEGGLDAVASLLNSSNALRTRWNWRSHTIGKSLGKSTRTLFPRTDRGKNFSYLARKRAAGFTGWRPVRQTVETFRATSVRTGIRQEAKVNTVERNIGDRVVDVSFIPFIRSRKVYFKAQLLKPNTRVYAFFDGIDVSQFCTSATFVEHSDNTTVDTSTFNSTDPLTTLGITRTELVTDNQGDLEGFFVIPNNETYKFRTGTRKFKLTDSSTDDLANTTTSAEKMYTASGLLQSKESQIVSTQEIEIERTRITRRINRRITRVVKGSTQYYDPLAQSFIIGNIPTGTFSTKIDLYFKAKSSNVPLSVHLVTVENGIPTQKIVPFSKVVKRPAEVNISDNASVATTFEFPSPVYLTPGVEYAIVVMSNSPDYRLWLSEVGGNDVTTGTRVSKNTYAGVSFKSQNASTWTPDQNKDFKMRIYRAEFSGGSGYTYRVDPLFNGDTFSFSTLSLLSEEINFPETQSSYVLRLNNNENYHLSPEDDTYFDDVKSITAAPSGNNAPASGEGAVNITLSTTSNYVSPVIDLNRLSLVASDNIISNAATVQPSNAASDTELLAGHGDATARYITREVELNNAADQLNIIMLANKPADDTEIRVYVRVKSSDERLRDVAFTKVEPTEPILIDSGNAFGEVEYSFQNTEPFTSFQVKVVFTSESTARTPRIKDFRAIATI